MNRKGVRVRRVDRLSGPMDGGRVTLARAAWDRSAAQQDTDWAEPTSEIQHISHAREFGSRRMSPRQRHEWNRPIWRLRIWSGVLPDEGFSFLRPHWPPPTNGQRQGPHMPRYNTSTCDQSDQTTRGNRCAKPCNLHVTTVRRRHRIGADQDDGLV